MNELLIHVGSPKTGTTSIQTFLSQNPHILLRNDYSYPDIHKEYSYIFEMGMRRCNVNGQHLEIVVFQEDERRKSIYYALLRRHLTHHSVILSEESLWLLSPEQLKAIFSELKERINIKIRVIVFLRRPDVYLESLWKQGVREYLLCTGVDDYIKSNLDKIDYLSRLQVIEEQIGHENIIVVPYETGQNRGIDSVKLFLDSIGINNNDIKIAVRDNMSFSEEAISYKIEFNKLYQELNGNKNLIYLDAIERAFLSWDNIQSAIKSTKKYGFMSQEIREEIIFKERDVLNDILMEYCNTTCDFLFKSNIISSYRNEVPKDYLKILRLAAIVGKEMGENYGIKSGINKDSSISIVNKVKQTNVYKRLRIKHRTYKIMKSL